MGQKIITLSGAATDVLYALFFRGALQSGDLPAKSGAAELRELGFAETRHTATEYQKENYFTFLTAEGQKFAIEHLVNTRFGKQVDQQYCAAITIGVEMDTTDAQKVIDELDEKIRNSEAFKALKDGWSHDKNGTMIINHGQVFIRDAMIQDGSITNAKIGSALTSNNGSVSTTYEMKIGIERGTDENVEGILKNALKNAAQSAAQDGAKRAGEDLKSKTKDIQLAMLYNGDHFSGIGLAVDGQLLSDQLDAKILQSVGAQAPAKLQVTFMLKEKSTGKPIRIDLAELRNSRGW
ncbi:MULTISPECIES: hypothetical protein [Enterobacteriaceae]|uniref:phage tail tip fiber protein n=1 Tax=Enterobacteriaceae TaxID=543 RepID=UPI000B145F0D|nr:MULTISPECIES: hypothetical protein [Enterobacteriaceae]